MAIAVTVTACVLALVIRVESSQAAFPGQNGKIAFVRTGSSYVMNADGSAQTNITPEFIDGALSPKWSSDGTKMVFWGITRSAEGLRVDIFAMNADGSDVTRLTDNPYDDTAPDWQPLRLPTTRTCLTAHEDNHIISAAMTTIAR